MHWWEETERRALGSRCGAARALTYWQRLKGAGCPGDLALLPAQALADLHGLAVDLVHGVDGLLVAPAGELETHLLTLRAWCRKAAFVLGESQRPFVLLLDGMRLEPEDWPEAPTPPEPDPAAFLPPEEAPKWEGRYERRHLLYERLDLRLEALGMAASVRRPFSHALATVYEEFLVLLRRLLALGGRERLRFRQAVELLTDVHATFHLDLLHRHLQPPTPEPGRPTIPGLALWTDLALAARSPGALPPEWLDPGAADPGAS